MSLQMQQTIVGNYIVVQPSVTGHTYTYMLRTESWAVLSFTRCIAGAIIQCKCSAACDMKSLNYAVVACN